MHVIIIITIFVPTTVVIIIIIIIIIIIVYIVFAHVFKLVKVANYVLNKSHASLHYLNIFINFCFT